ncbi:MAG TPA: hypothetical protein VFX96_10120 [Pyrinomonadaceae bacterium]|nr:hypothetical protein [Pyrinomonadaceae bacterium]
MSGHKSPLDNLKVAAPCAADWSEMTGDERVRFCGSCELNVYNLSGMTRAEAEGLIANTEGRLCVRFFRRADGTILTENCPVGLRALKRRVSRVANATVSAVLGFLAGLGLTTTFGEKLGRELPLYPHTMGAMVASPPRDATPDSPLTRIVPKAEKVEGRVGVDGEFEIGKVAPSADTPPPRNSVVSLEEMEKMKKVKKAKR